MSIETPRPASPRALPTPPVETRDKRRARLIAERERVIDALADMDREDDA